MDAPPDLPPLRGLGDVQRALHANRPISHHATLDIGENRVDDPIHAEDRGGNSLCVVDIGCDRNCAAGFRRRERGAGSDRMTSRDPDDVPGGVEALDDAATKKAGPAKDGDQRDSDPP